MDFNDNGLSLNDDFKQYFLRASNNRIEETYDQFKIDSMWKNSGNVNANVRMLGADGPVEIIDSSDEEDQTENVVKLESPEMVSGIQSDGNAIPPQLNDDFEYDRDYIEDVLNLNLNWYRDASQNKQDCIEIEMDTVMKVEEKAFNGHGDMDLTNKRTSPVSVSNESNKVNDSKRYITKGRSYRRPRKQIASGSTVYVFGNKNSSNPMDTKKRHKCQLCEYSSNLRADVNKHTRIHTGEKPYRCDICRKEFTQLHHMKRHKVNHIEQIPFHCRGCFAGFLEKDEKDGHEKWCKARRYECHICKKYVTLNKKLLEVHMRKHNGEKSIKNTYDEFEISSIFEDVSTSTTDEYLNLFHTPRYDMNNTQQTTNEPFEIIDTSDEEDEAPKMIRAIRYDGHGISKELNDYGQFDYDESYTEMSDMKSNVFDYQQDVSNNRGEYRIRNEIDNAMKADEMERDDGIPIVGITMDTMGQNTSTVKSSNKSNNVIGAKRNNMKGRSVGHPRKQTESLRRKSSTSSKLIDTKNKFQCHSCEYSSNHKGNFNVHMRTHTGEKPYRCDICRKGFTIMQNMKKHKHICKKYVTSQKNRLKKHMRTHNGEKPFRCAI
ncbi:zinc finger protein 432-like [Contarinia nasturtii]|uniref:zinc finger protein 432-like n=1 Tax=Contarinia nasturtii TaxID=265458 RepID=UPI0012D3C9CD|nr:zinc finger protein 432-like [Contarinia nasturtii]